MNTLVKFSLRHILHRPLRALLTLGSIVLGVALLVAVSVATSTTRRAYYEMFSTVTGKTALEVVPSGGGVFDEGVLAAIEQTPGVAAASPLLRRPTILYHGESRAKLLTLGVDPQRDKAIRTYALKEGRLFEPRESGMVLEAEFARGLGLTLGDRPKILTRDGAREIEVVGLLSSQGAESLRLAGVVFIPLERAQRWFRARGEVESIQIVVEDGADEREVQARLAAALPQGLVAQRPSVRTQIMDETMSGSQQGLRWMTVFAMLSAAFIILNTFLMSIGERRQQLAIMRCVGATQGQIARLILGESLVMGVLGSLLGIALGLVGATLLGDAMSQLMQVQQPPMQISWHPIALAMCFGIGLSFAGAVIPTVLAAQLSPLEGLSPLAPSEQRGGSPRVTLAGLIVCGGASVVLAASLVGWLPIDASVWAAGALMVGAVLLVPEVLTGLSRLLVWLLVPLMGIEARLAHREVVRHRFRSGLTVGVLFVATSTGLGMANAVLDSVQDTRNWYERTLVGDFFIRAMMPDMTGGEAANIPDEMGDELRQVPGIDRLDTAKFLQATAAGQQVMVIVRDFKRDQRLFIDIRGADPDEVLNELFEGGVIIGTVLAQKTGLQVGDALPIETRQGAQTVRVAALSNEYLVGGLAIYMERGAAQRLFDVDGVDAYVIKADPERRAEVEARLRPLCEKYGVLLHSFADIATMIDGMMRGIEVGLWGAIVACFVVAAFGVVNTLSMNVLEQTRELGLLRIVAMTRRQVRATVFAQAGIIGVIGLLAGAVGGFVIAYLMHLAMMQSIGHPVPFIFRPWWYVAMAAVGLVIVLLSAWLPAERAARLNLTTALQYE